MRVLVAAVGKLKDGAERELCARYTGRIAAAGRTVGLAPFDLIELPESRAQTAMARMDDEANRLVARCGASDFRVVLDERAKALSSPAFAEKLREIRDRSTGGIAFLIGGPDGHGAAAREAAGLMLSLGPMTLPHGLARIVLVEQIYRAITILSGHPYHRV